MTDYRDIVAEVVDYFRERTAQLRERGVRRIVVDPGFGFAKTLEQNYELLRGLHRLAELGYPVLLRQLRHRRPEHGHRPQR